MATRDTLPIRTRESLSHNEKLGPDATDANAKPHKNPNGEKNQKNQKNKKNGTAKENTGRFTGYYGTNFDGLDPWVRLCRDLGVEGPLNSKKQCKKVGDSIFVGPVTCNSLWLSFSFLPFFPFSFLAPALPAHSG